jgi:hypothetical protein
MSSTKRRPRNISEVKSIPAKPIRPERLEPCNIEPELVEFANSMPSAPRVLFADVACVPDRNHLLAPDWNNTPNTTIKVQVVGRDGLNPAGPEMRLDKDSELRPKNGNI